MKISMMREFVRLAENRNYSKTAAELYIAQPALSRHMISLEEELDVKLIQRDRNVFELTAAGKIVLEDFRRILDDYERMLERVSRIEEIENGELHIGFLYYDTDYYVARIRDSFRKKYPKVHLILHSYQPAQLEEALLSGKIDAALIYGVSGSLRRDIEYLSFLKIPWLLMYHQTHRLSGQKDISISDLDGEKMLLPRTPFEINGVQGQMEQMLQKGGARISKRIPIDNYDEIPWLLEETEAIYLSPMVNHVIYGNHTEWRYLLPEIYHTDVSAVWLKEKKNPAIKLLSTAIRSCYP